MIRVLWPRMAWGRQPISHHASCCCCCCCCCCWYWGSRGSSHSQQGTPRLGQCRSKYNLPHFIIDWLGFISPDRSWFRTPGRHLTRSRGPNLGRYLAGQLVSWSTGQRGTGYQHGLNYHELKNSTKDQRFTTVFSTVPPSTTDIVLFPHPTPNIR